MRVSLGKPPSQTPKCKTWNAEKALRLPPDHPRRISCEEQTRVEESRRKVGKLLQETYSKDSQEPTRYPTENLLSISITPHGLQIHN